MRHDALRGLDGARCHTTSMPVRTSSFDAARAWLRHRTDYVAVASFALFAHALAYLDGVSIGPASFYPTNLTNSWHLLRTGLLRNDAVNSIWSLHSQPPLFNAQTALLLHLPQPWVWATWLQIIGSLVTVLATYGVLRRLHVHRAFAVIAVLVLVACDPGRLLYVGWYSYEVMTACTVSLAAWAIIAWAQTGMRRHFAVFIVSVSYLTLYNATDHVLLLLIPAIPVLWRRRKHWRDLLRVAATPLLIVTVWYGHDVVSFGQFSTSSWLGMNLARNTLMTDAPANIAAMVSAKQLTPIALVRPFSPPDAYQGLVAPSKATSPALSEKWNETTPPVPNYNWDGYRAVAKAYLHDDLSWIINRPTTYLHHVALSAWFWTLPLSQWRDVDQGNVAHLSGYTTAYTHFIDLQIAPNPNADVNFIQGHLDRTWKSISFTALLETVLAVFVFPLLLWRRRRDHDLTLALVWVWCVTTALVAITSLVEVGENNRFRFGTGGLLVILSIVSVSWLWDRTRHVVRR